MSEAAQETAVHHEDQEHGHVGSVQTRLIATFVGGVFILNAYLADWLIAGTETVGTFSAAIGAVILCTPIVIGGLKEMRRGRMHMSVLVMIAVLAAFALSSYRVAGIVAFFMLLASLIEQKTAEGARQSIEKLMTLTPDTAELENGEVVQVSELEKGQIVRIHPGDRIPADGKVIKGETTIDESTITGESFPADKGVGEEVFAGTHNLTGYVEVEVRSAGEDTTLGKVKNLILEAEATKTPIMQIIDRYAEWYTPVMLMVALIIWIFTNDPERVIAALVVACPCAFVLATPTAMVAGLSAAARLGVLVKNVAHLEAASDITAMVFDKTGTLTTGQLTVTKLSPAEGVDGAELLEAASSVEQKSRHPIARAIVKVAKKAHVMMAEPDELHETPGKGVRGVVRGEEVVVGRDELLESHDIEVDPEGDAQRTAKEQGASILHVGRDGRYLGWIGLEDKPREQAKQATSELKELGVGNLTMLTGDHWSVARKVAGDLGCTEVQAECLPEQKLELVERLRQEGNEVAVVGDGVNDGPALAAGDLGIAMGAAGSDVAINSASIALMSNDLDRLPFLIRLSRKLKSVIFQNLLFGAVFVVGGLLLSTFGYLTPVLAAVLHNVGSFGVIFNSARLVRHGESLSPYEEAQATETSSQPAASPA